MWDRRCQALLDSKREKSSSKAFAVRYERGDEQRSDPRTVAWLRPSTMRRSYQSFTPVSLTSFLSPSHMRLQRLVDRRRQSYGATRARPPWRRRSAARRRGGSARKLP